MQCQGCRVALTAETANDHKTIMCTAALVPCIVGCGAKIRRGDACARISHLASCPKWLVACAECGSSVPRSDWESHASKCRRDRKAPPEARESAVKSRGQKDDIKKRLMYAWCVECSGPLLSYDPHKTVCYSCDAKRRRLEAKRKAALRSLSETKGRGSGEQVDWSLMRGLKPSEIRDRLLDQAAPASGTKAGGSKARAHGAMSTRQLRAILDRVTREATIFKSPSTTSDPFPPRTPKTETASRRDSIASIASSVAQMPTLAEAKASFKGDPSQGSISFERGDVLEILDQDGAWWKARVRSEVGLVPSNYLLLLSDGDFVDAGDDGESPEELSRGDRRSGRSLSGLSAAELSGDGSPGLVENGLEIDDRYRTGSEPRRVHEDVEEEIDISIPPGAQPGAILNIDVDGERIQVVVPPGARPGDTLRVSLPALREGRSELSPPASPDAPRAQSTPASPTQVAAQAVFKNILSTSAPQSAETFNNSEASGPESADLTPVCSFLRLEDAAVAGLVDAAVRSGVISSSLHVDEDTFLTLAKGLAGRVGPEKINKLFGAFLEYRSFKLQSVGPSAKSQTPKAPEPKSVDKSQGSAAKATPKHSDVKTMDSPVETDPRTETEPKNKTAESNIDTASAAQPSAETKAVPTQPETKRKDELRTKVRPENKDKPENMDKPDIKVETENKDKAETEIKMKPQPTPIAKLPEHQRRPEAPSAAKVNRKSWRDVRAPPATPPKPAAATRTQSPPNTPKLASEAISTPATPAPLSPPRQQQTPARASGPVTSPPKIATPTPDRARRSTPRTEAAAAATLELGSPPKETDLAYQRLQKRARQAMQKGDHKEAERLFKAAIQAANDRVESGSGGYLSGMSGVVSNTARSVCRVSLWPFFR